MGNACCAHCQHRGGVLVDASDSVFENAQAEKVPSRDGSEDDNLEIFPASCPVARVGVPEVLARKDVAERQNLAMQEVVELFDVTVDDAFALLKAYAWNQDRLSDDFFTDPDAVRNMVGIRHASDSTEKPTKGDVCAICFSNVPISMLQCGHDVYCEDCWSRYIETAVQEGKACVDLRCPTAKCGERLPHADIVRFCSDEMRQRYELFKVDSFVDDNGELAWCPGRGCTRAARLTSGCSKSATVQCLCGLQWCFGCKSDLHSPVQCEVVQKWNKKCKATSQDDIWIVQNTKPCPKCAKPIHKDGGCMHMTCRPPGGCKHEFCWICLGDWRTHKTCNTFEDQEKPAAKDSAANIQRYVHYFSRFSEHEKAQAFANTSQRKTIADIGTILHEAQGIPVKDLEFLNASVDQIVACRRFLKWTYAFAYQAAPSMEEARRNLFEFQQAQLEGTLERLSHFTENIPWEGHRTAEASSKQSFPDMRAQVVSLVDVVKKSFSTLSESMASLEVST